MTDELIELVLKNEKLKRIHEDLLKRMKRDKYGNKLNDLRDKLKIFGDKKYKSIAYDEINGYRI